MMGCLILAELLAIAFFSLWPVNPKGNENNQIVSFSDDVIAIQDAVITRQQGGPPPPPQPQSPIPIPKDEIIEEEITEINDIKVTDYSDSLSVTMLGSQGDSDQPVTNPQTAPSIIRIVEPTVPEAAKKAKVKAEIWVNFLVDRQGRVEEATISQIKRYDPTSDSMREVERIGYGLTEATINAALQWKFRPAKDNGEKVKAYTRHIFTFGF
jgi:hypothetical protein